MCDSERSTHAQGGSFAYLTPAFAIIAQVKARGAWVDAADGTNHARFLVQTHYVNAISTMHTIAWHSGLYWVQQPGQVHSNAQRIACKGRHQPRALPGANSTLSTLTCGCSSVRGLKQSGKCTQPSLTAAHIGTLPVS